jgi:hypothetical protein
MLAAKKKPKKSPNPSYVLSHRARKSALAIERDGLDPILSRLLYDLADEVEMLLGDARAKRADDAHSKALEAASRKRWRPAPGTAPYRAEVVVPADYYALLEAVADAAAQVLDDGRLDERAPLLRRALQGADAERDTFLMCDERDPES